MTRKEAIAGSQEVATDESMPSRLRETLEEASSILVSWAASEQSDSVSRQGRRKAEYVRACELLEDIHSDGLRTDTVMSLTLPAGEAEQFRPYRFSKNAYDFIEKRKGKPLEPGQTMFLKNNRSLNNLAQRATNAYYGDYRCYFEVADIARILAAGGSLGLANCSEPE